MVDAMIYGRGGVARHATLGLRRVELKKHGGYPLEAIDSRDLLTNDQPAEHAGRSKPMTATETTVTCTWCGGRINDPDEAADPRRDEKGMVICRNCYHDHYEFTCCWCEEDEDAEYQHEVLVVFERMNSLGKTIVPGLYRITKKPYIRDEIIDASIMRRCLTPIARRLPPSLARCAEDYGYPCGHLCRRCQRKVGVVSSLNQPASSMGKGSTDVS